MYWIASEPSAKDWEWTFYALTPLTVLTAYLTVCDMLTEPTTDMN
jgi:hypothetical protein